MVFNTGSVLCDNEINLFSMIMISMRINVWFLYRKHDLCVCLNCFCSGVRNPQIFSDPSSNITPENFFLRWVCFLWHREKFRSHGMRNSKTAFNPRQLGLCAKGAFDGCLRHFWDAENWGWVTVHKGITIDSYQFYWGTLKCFFNSLVPSLINSQKTRKQNPLWKLNFAFTDLGDSANREVSNGVGE